jgi:two-component system sensor histidine kinase UhpB
VRLEIADDGSGLPDDARLNGGIRGMRERAVLIGGRLHVDSAPVRGTTVQLRVPPEVLPS